METSRNNTTGEISVRTKTFAVTISEDGIRVQIGDALAHEWKLDSPTTLTALPDRADQPSPRSRPNRRRGAR